MPLGRSAGVFALIAAAVSFVHFREKPLERVERFSLQAPEGADFSNLSRLPAISPDGRHVAFSTTGGLWVRDLDGLNARILTSAPDTIYPFWSPDSRWIGFFTQSKLEKIAVGGGPPTTICDAPIARGGTWSEEGVIVYALANIGLFRVSATGGTPEALTKVDEASGHVSNRLPWFLPDGRRFLYTARNNDPEKTQVYVDSIDARPGSRTGKAVLRAESNVVYVPPVRSSQGYLLFVRGRTLMAQPFDASKAQTTGDPVNVAEQVDFLTAVSQGQFSASRNGTLVYTSGAVGQNKQLTWFDRSGKSLGTVGAPANTTITAISPDVLTIAANIMNSGTTDIWLYDLRRGATSRFTFNQAGCPVWSPDGGRIAYCSTEWGNTNIKSTSRTRAEQGFDRLSSRDVVSDWSRDGRYLIEDLISPETGRDVWVVPQFGDRKPFPFLRARYNEGYSKLSPDGQWLAYVSDESRSNEVYVQAFPEHGGKWQISTNGGNWPVWSRGGRELYFIAADRKMMAVEIKLSDGQFEPGVPKPLFQVPEIAQYDVSKDGRFLIQVPVDRGARNVAITVVTNWQAALKK